MSNNDCSQDNTSSPNPQKMRFVNDLVNYILQANSLPGILLSSERQEESEVRIWDKNIRMAVAITTNKCKRLTDMSFNFFMDKNLNDSSSFAYYAKEVKGKFLGNDDDDIERFLDYSVHLAHLAGKMYARGLNEAPRIAVRYIVEAMDFELARFGYEITRMIARECGRQSIYNSVIYRQHAEQGYGQHTNPYIVSSSWGIIGVPGSSRTEPTTLNSSEDKNKQQKKSKLHDNIEITKI